MNNTKSIRAAIVIGVMAMVALSFNSCKLYGKYDSKTTAEIDSIPVPTYTEIFTDPQLQSLIDLALKNNYDLRMAHERVNQAKAQLLGAKLAFLPSIYAGGSPVGQMTATTSAVTSYSHTFATASWEIDIFGKLLNQKRMAEAGYKQSQDFEQAARAELVAGVAETYYLLLMYDALIRTAEDAVDTWKQSVETMREMKKAGMSDEAAVSQFEGSYYATRADHKQYLLEREFALSAMYLLLSTDSLNDIARSNLRATTYNDNLTTVDLRAVQIRPDVKAAEHQIEYAFYNRNRSIANCCPSITLSGTVGWANGGVLFNAVGGLLQPIFNAGKNISDVRVSKSQLEEMQYNYANALLKAGTEVNDALAERRIYNEKTAEHLNRVDAMERAYDATYTKMRLGQGTYLEVLMAQNDLINSRYSLIQNYRNILQANVNLYLALGGGK